MKFLKVSIVHFQPLEKYPPVMNILKYFSKQDSPKINAYSVLDPKYKENLFYVKGINIYRTAVLSKNHSSLKRYFGYVKFNIITIVLLILKKPNVLIIYETISIFPAFIYKKLFPSTKLYIHFHEYTSLDEYNKSSAYIKWLYLLETKLYSASNWISHTNSDRLNFFRTDHATVKFRNLQVMPNYPPEEWYKETIVKGAIFNPVKFVYVGALSLDSMYTREFAEWIKQLNGTAIWDIYSGNYTEEAFNFIKTVNCSCISFKGEVDYYDLPKVLCDYDIGLILYNGHIPNYIYNAPNKLFEYHACNLDAWVSEDIKGSLSYIREHTYPKILRINFKSLSNLDLDSVLNRQAITYYSCNYTAEQAFAKLNSQLQ